MLFIIMLKMDVILIFSFFFFSRATYSDIVKKDLNTKNDPSVASSEATSSTGISSSTTNITASSFGAGVYSFKNFPSKRFRLAEKFATINIKLKLFLFFIS